MYFDKLTEFRYLQLCIFLQLITINNLSEVVVTIWFHSDQFLGA